MSTGKVATVDKSTKAESTTKKEPMPESTTKKGPKPILLRTLPSGEKILHTECKKVEKITPGIRTFAAFLEKYLLDRTNDSYRPIAIAAPQFGKSIRMFACEYESKGSVITLINPELVYEKKSRLIKESCLSIPNKVFQVKRGKVVKIRGMGLDGAIHTYKGRDVTAQMFLHELNHLDGITIDMIGELLVR